MGKERYSIMVPTNDAIIELGDEVSSLSIADIVNLSVKEFKGNKRFPPSKPGFIKRKMNAIRKFYAAYTKAGGSILQVDGEQLPAFWSHSAESYQEGIWLAELYLLACRLLCEKPLIDTDLEGM